MPDLPAIKLLIVDDSFFMRTLVASILRNEPDIEVVGEAKNGKEALAMALALKPDVVTMDYLMPEMDGAEATARIIEAADKPPAIIMLSARTQAGSEETLKSLRYGALDFLSKPSGEVSIDLETIKTQLLEKIRIAAQAKIFKRSKVFYPSKSLNRLNRHGVKALVIGASTGGPPVVENILVNLPHDLASAVFIVQHMPEKFTAFFAQRLQKVSPLPIKEAEEGDVIISGHCYLAPGGWHMEIKEDKGIKKIHLNKDEPYLGLRPAINVTMVSAAEHYGADVAGIVLTGMGNDGADGMAAIKRRGGYGMVQSLDSSVVSSMPSSVIKVGAADEVLPPAQLIDRIIEITDIYG